MSVTLQFKLTQNGQSALWNASHTGTALNLTHIQFGSGNRAPSGTETALLDPQQATAIAAGFAVSATQIRMSAIFGGHQNYVVREVGLWAGDPAVAGARLVGYWSQAAGDLAMKSPGVDFIFSHDMTLDAAVPAGSLTILADHAQSAMLAMIAAHEAAGNPHPQYATTAFLQRRGVQFAEVVPVLASRYATAEDVGHILWMGGAHTLTLPTPQSLGMTAGSTITVYGTAGAAGGMATVAAGAGASFDNRGHAGATVSIKDDFCIFVAGSGTQWAQLGTADLQKTADFAQSKTANGYQRLPGGLIIQWGTTAVANGAPQTTSWPIAFPTGCAGFSGCTGAANANAATVQIHGSTNTHFTWSVNTARNTYAVGVSVVWLAIGY